jgi:hypothetical protein
MLWKLTRKEKEIKNAKKVECCKIYCCKSLHGGKKREIRQGTT